MHVFVTGATGWIGSHTVEQLLKHGHEVTGLARSDASATTLRTKGAAVLRGDLDDPDALRRGAEAADGVIHLANKHNWSDVEGMNAAERAATNTIGEALTGTDKPLVLASGLAQPNGGTPLTENDPSPFTGPDAPRGGSENLALEFVDRGVRTVIVRFAPTVHGTGDQGFIAAIANGARTQSASLYAGDGTNRWPAVHVDDAAAVVRLGLEHAPAGTIVHATAETGIRTKDIAEAIGETLNLPVRSVEPQQLAEQLGFIGQVFSMDIPAASDATRKLLGWTPVGPTLLEDIAAGAYDGA